jgi:hypothetical protein
MSDLHVRHLVASVHGTREQAARARTLLQRVADQRLDARMGSAPLPEGEWCVRRVEVQLPLADDADGVVEQRVAGRGHWRPLFRVNPGRLFVNSR